MFEVTAGDRGILEAWIRAHSTEQRLVTRARIVLALADGASNVQVAEKVGTRTATVSKWRGRYRAGGLAALRDAERSGRPATYTELTEQRILSALREPPPHGFGRWNGRLLAAVLGDVSVSCVWRTLRAHGISLAEVADG